MNIFDGHIESSKEFVNNISSISIDSWSEF